MTKSPYVFGAQNHTYLLVVSLPEDGLEEDAEVFDFLGGMIEKHVVVGWEVNGTWAAPLGVYSVQCEYGAAVLLSTGEVADFDGGTTHPTIDDWAYAVMDRIRNGGTNRRALMRGQVDADVVAPGEDSEDSPAIDSFGWSGRAVAPLQRKGIKTLADFSNYKRKIIKGVNGVSIKAFYAIESELLRHGIPWADGPGKWKSKLHVGSEPEAEAIAAGRRQIPQAIVDVTKDDDDDLNDLV